MSTPLRSPSPTSASDHDDNLSYSSATSSSTIRREFSTLDQFTSNNPVVMPESEEDNGSFGSPIQRFSKEMINSLSKYKVSEDLTDSNYPTWSQSVKEVFVSMRLDKFLKISNHRDQNLSAEKNEVISFNITTFILNRLDEHNTSQVRNHLTDPDDPTEILYDPFKCWEYLKQRHNEITEDKLTAVTKALHGCRILKSDTLSLYLDKFENLVREYYYYRGQMTDTQSARMLILSIPSLSETTIELIYATVRPLTRKGVSDYLRQYEQRHEWSSHAIREVNGVSAGQSQKKNSSSKCTESECVGPHPARDCWSKPENFEKRDKYFARRKGQTSTASVAGQGQPAGIRGIKKVT